MLNSFHMAGREQYGEYHIGVKDFNPSVWPNHNPNQDFLQWQLDFVVLDACLVINLGFYDL